ncbi:DegV family protein [Streptococcus sp. X16XC17]|uniref:DegV family protein n=1 Tax=unclassified Streptococcus TaxID=2608887 RepID=UPI00066FF47A|nr:MULTISPECIES: DegV family protein [unclassified Streptococcus]TCD45751.1 DegV family protein [Streptococcus sp. X16XC17]
MTFKILTDSTADLPEKWVRENDVTVMGLAVQLNDQTFETVGPARLTSEILLREMEKGAQPKTSQVNVGQFEAVFQEAVDKGEAILYLVFSSALSGTYQSAVIARELIREEHPEAKIQIIDTKAATIGEGYLVMKAAEARAAGKTLEETIHEIVQLAPYLHTYMIVDDLEHLVRGGRLSKVAAMVGGLMNIKPLISINSEGRLESIGKIRGRKKGVAEMVARTLSDLNDDTILIAYTGDQQAAEELKERLLQESGVERVIVAPLGPVIAAHTGNNILALLSIGKSRR